MHSCHHALTNNACALAPGFYSDHRGHRIDLPLRAPVETFAANRIEPLRSIVSDRPRDQMFDLLVKGRFGGTYLLRDLVRQFLRSLLMECAMCDHPPLYARED
jgi:hypothetical protein